MKRVLIVEDQEDVRELIRLTLELEDLEVHEAGNGDSGLEQVRSLHPDLVLLDVMMPGSMDGFQVCHAIKSDPALRRTKVVMLSARSQQSDMQHGLDVGADGYLVKPFSPRKLLEVVNKQLG